MDGRLKQVIAHCHDRNDGAVIQGGTAILKSKSALAGIASDPEKTASRAP
jgi:hypothetical protein